MTGSRQASWICCHLGAREHYAVPRALHKAGRLAQLITDAWADPRTIEASIAATFSTRFAQRFHEDLGGVDVRPLSRSLVAHEIQWRLQQREGWDLAMLRNEWFESAAAAKLPETVAERTMLFAHSYSAEAIFTEARQRGWTTVLGQIDPGPEHIAAQARLAAGRPEFGGAPAAPPARYFDKWRHECELADWIVVNSDWSRESLMRAGVPERKLRTIALPYERDAHLEFERAYPPAFSDQRPMRVLVVGTASVVKGLADVLLAFDRLDGAPIELWVVGDRALHVPDRFLNNPRIHWVGRVDRHAVMDHYRAGDLLIFPSHSDGFGMAQIEAQGWGLPIVASRHCGRVVRDNETGWLLNEVSPAAIADTLGRAAREPETLARFARACRLTPRAGIDALAAGLIALEQS
ncbi:MAG TPA: glycosyltransferase family 4 protein [Vicinamibacterales bacterium]|nr:glycosyltransferase family 4 protein [Vicinamibacterales bacterium]